jgi:hypothetical protein
MSDRDESVLRRSSNEGRRHLFGLTHRLIAFVCECSREACYETVPLTAAEYDARRPGPIVLDAHATPTPVEQERRSSRSARSGGRQVARASDLVGESELRRDTPPIRG